MILTVLYDHDFLYYIGISAKYDGGEGGGRWGRRKMGSNDIANFSFISFEENQFLLAPFENNLFFSHL